MIFVDTNYFVRFFVDDDHAQHQAVKQLFLKATNGEAELCTSPLVFFETAWVLASVYDVTGTRLHEVMQGFLEMGFIKIEERELLREALVLARQHKVAIEDGYHLAWAKAKGCIEMATFDRKVKRASSE